MISPISLSNIVSWQNPSLNYIQLIYLVSVCNQAVFLGKKHTLADFECIVWSQNSRGHATLLRNAV